MGNSSSVHYFNDIMRYEVSLENEEELLMVQRYTNELTLNRYTKDQVKDKIKLDHLSKKEKRILKRAALDYVNSNFGDTAQLSGMGVGFTFHEMIALLRSDVREHKPVLKEHDDEALDKWIVGMIQNGNDIIELVLT